jgi:hypothetical protein
MAAAVQQLKLEDFSGGLNLRRSEFTLAKSESPDMLNVEYAEGGIRTRRGWESWNAVPITTPANWNPRTAFLHERSSGLDSLIVANQVDGKLYWSTNGTFVPLKIGATDQTANAGIHRADFAPWGDKVYIARGNQDVLSWDGVSTTATAVAAAPSAVAWGEDYLVPPAAQMVRANYVAAHGGRVWVASTVENGVAFPHRIRWSHPNNPLAWKSTDYLDIRVGGGVITALVPMSDHLLVFKASSVFAIYGYDGESQQLVNVSWTKGARNRQLVARSESACYFMSYPDGIFKIENSTAPQEVSMSLRPMLASSGFNVWAADNQWLGWLGNRLWWSVPYLESGVAADARATFVLDTTVAGGSWTKFESASGFGLGPFVQGGYAQGSYDLYGFCRDVAHVVRVDERKEATDIIAGVTSPFQSRFTTPWVDAGYPDLKKRWKRPTFVSLDAGSDYTFQVAVRSNFEKAIVRRFGVGLKTAATSIRYGDGSTYGGGAKYASAFDEEMRLSKGSSLGTMAATQLQLDGEPGVPWGIGSIVFKFRARRMS